MNQITDIIVTQNAELKKLNTYRIEARAKYLIEVKSIQGLKDILKYLEENRIDYFILGAGSNVILGDYFEGAIIKLSGLNKLEIKDNSVYVEAGVMMGHLAQSTVNHNLTGLEWAINIPGSVGGSICGNAGAYNSEMFDQLVKITVLTKDLEIKEVKKEELIFSYRSTNIKELGYIVLAGYFKLEAGDKEDSIELIQDRCARRLAAQPLDKPSAGSVFRNPVGDYAGRLIEEAGLKGKTIGGAQVSKKHANFIVNIGDATSNDIKNLIKLVKEEVKRQFNVDLILEQEIVDWK